jgi:protein-S-isoprenylcysteine O-methyltransferase Ste14
MRIFVLILIVFWVSFYVYWGVSARGAKRVIHRANRWAGFGSLIIILVGVALSRLAGFHLAFIPRSDGVLAFGTAICGLGLALAIWARRHLGTNWSREPSIQAGHELVMSGPYRFLRHPIYSGILTAIVGTVFVAGRLWLIMFIGFLPMFVWRVKKEEEFMTRLFPQQYPEYKKRTNALIPFVW